ncbi:N-acetylglucosamine-1-phosphate uridyltransferase / Glucosamine-1-phosphate N-acetyltransferase [hydrothermal vent metagenome]|uniref:UDP-N-acetylglucosamine diphosphorylase n=1 Tax=hydrothermal vent metagenome TaxID=652676 RepID=A0A3B1CNS1_9ZZZZ
MNENKNVAVVIMAAGKGTRMRTDLPKVLTPMKGRPLLSYVLKAARGINPALIAVIVGHKRDMVTDRFKADDIAFVTQEPQLGTGHAVAQAEQVLADFDGDIVTLSGDVPLIKKETIEKLISAHRGADAVLTVLTCDLDDPASYGRITRAGGKIAGNVEAKDATADQLNVKEINCGIYVFKSSFLFPALKQVNNNNAQGEYYLTDLINMAVADGHTVCGVKTEDRAEALGVNTAKDLEALEDGVK